FCAVLVFLSDSFDSRSCCILFVKNFFIFLNFFFEEIHLRSAGHINSVLLCVPLSDSSGVCCAVMLLAVNGERGI
ncbi:MAG: hypothetical protein UEC12_06575, partial [Lachnospiraceae bacterium]|nr:hypothetical protein [Lachnospiraceae bacterium]